MRYPSRLPTPYSRLFFQNRHARWFSGNNQAPLHEPYLKVHAELSDQEKVSMDSSLLLPISTGFLSTTHKMHRARAVSGRLKICITHNHYSRRGEVKQEGMRAQLKKVRVKGEWPQAGTALAGVGSSPRLKSHHCQGPRWSISLPLPAT